MATYSHVAVTLLGSFVANNYWDSEIAQTGVRIAAWPSTTSPDLDAPLPLRECDIVYDEVNTSEYLGVVGFHGDQEYWSTSDQLEIADNMVNWADDIKASLYNGFEWTGIKLSPILPTGGLAASSTLLSLKVPIKGTATTVLPPQVSVACSFRSNVPGRRGRGRMYAPAIADNVAAATGTIGSTARNVFGNATRGLLDGVDSSGGLGVRYAIVVTSQGNPRYVLPTQVRIGDQFDTQRRRRNQVRETYSTY